MAEAKSAFSRVAELWREMNTKKMKLVREESPLEKVFTTTRAWLFCFGAITGIVLYTEVAENTMNLGPLATSWYVIGGIIGLLIGKSYGELVSLAPCSGAIYHYTYHTMGELTAFLTGWLMILSLSLKYISCVRSLVGYIDFSFFDGSIQQFFNSFLTMYRFSETSFLESVPDLLCLPLSLFLGGLYVTFSKESSLVNSILCVTSIIVTAASFLLFMYFADLQELHFDAPFNRTSEFFSKGLSIAQFSYSGLELTAFLGEEATDPSDTVPKGILIGTVTAIVCYAVMSFVFSILPREVCVKSKGNVIKLLALLHVHQSFGWFIGLGAVCSIATSTYAHMFALVRLIYSMSQDGMLSSLLATVHNKTKTPLISIYKTAFLLGTLGTFIKLKYILELSNFYVSMEYFMITVCLLITRYRCEEDHQTEDIYKRWFLINYPRNTVRPTKATERASLFLIVLCILFIYSASLFLRMFDGEREILPKIGFVTCISFFIVFGVLLGRQPQNNRKALQFSVGGCPYVTLFLMAHSVLMSERYSSSLWVISICWLLIGFVIYLIYSRRHAAQSRRALSQNQQRPSKITSWESIEFLSRVD